MAKTKPTEQDDAVNDGPPKFGKLSEEQVADLIRVGFDAVGANQPMTRADVFGRTWGFMPDTDGGQTGLRVWLVYGEHHLGANKLPSSQLQCEAGEQLLRSAILILAGA